MGESFKSKSSVKRLLLQKHLIAECRGYAQESGMTVSGFVERCVNASVQAMDNLRYIKFEPDPEDLLTRSMWDRFPISDHFYYKIQSRARNEGYTENAFARLMLAIACEALRSLECHLRKNVSEEGLCRLIERRFEDLAQRTKIAIETAEISFQT